VLTADKSKAKSGSAVQRFEADRHFGPSGDFGVQSENWLL
jgi:hypothetical protein